MCGLMSIDPGNIQRVSVLEGTCGGRLGGDAFAVLFLANQWFAHGLCDGRSGRPNEEAAVNDDVVGVDGMVPAAAS